MADLDWCPECQNSIIRLGTIMCFETLFPSLLQQEVQSYGLGILTELSFFNQATDYSWGLLGKDKKSTFLGLGRDWAHPWVIDGGIFIEEGYSHSITLKPQKETMNATYCKQ